MPNKGDRGGAKTRARIAEIATELFLQRGFDSVTIAEVASAADVSKVTVFKHFERKEDLLLDRLPEALELLTSAVRQRETGTGILDALRRMASSAALERHPLSGLGEGVEPFIRTIMDSEALIARLRVFAHEAESRIADLLEADDDFHGDGKLTAALVVAAYRTVAVETVQLRLSGQNLPLVADQHLRRVNSAFDAVMRAVSGDPACSKKS